MRTGFPTDTLQLSLTLIAAGLAVSCSDQGLPTPPTSRPAGQTGAQFAQVASQENARGAGATVHVPGDYATIQEAVNAAGVGGKVFVHAGTYSENVIIRHSGLRLHAAGKAVLDGTGLEGIGIHVLGTTSQPVRDVEVSGFEVRNFERGLVVQFGRNAVIHGNEFHHNVNKVGPLLIGDASGIDLTPGFSNKVTGNDVHNNGDVGVLIRDGAVDNLIKGNSFHENGTQLAGPTEMRGRGVGLTGAGTTRNVVEENQIDRNWGRGIFVVRPPGTTPISGNRLERNHLEGNQRAGIAVMFSAADNFILQNDARGNNLANLAPCFRCNLLDLTPLGNTWEKNKGTFNLTDDCEN
jgi:parallel beta-helix repeat protein